MKNMHEGNAFSCIALQAADHIKLISHCASYQREYQMGCPQITNIDTDTIKLYKIKQVVLLVL